MASVYRADIKYNGLIKPFTEDCMEEMLSGPASIHPRKTLATAANVVQYVIDKKLTSIDAESVNAAGTDTTLSTTEPDFTEGIDRAT